MESEGRSVVGGFCPGPVIHHNYLTQNQFAWSSGCHSRWSDYSKDAAYYLKLIKEQALFRLYNVMDTPGAGRLKKNDSLQRCKTKIPASHKSHFSLTLSHRVHRTSPGVRCRGGWHLFYPLSIKFFSSPTLFTFDSNLNVNVSRTCPQLNLPWGCFAVQLLPASFSRTPSQLPARVSISELYQTLSALR